MRVRFAIASLAVLPSALLSAQVDRITIRMIPAPNQTLHVRTLMETTMNAVTDPSSGRSLPIPPMSTNIKTVTDSTSTVGPTDAQGHYQARVVFDTASYTAMLNGQPMPANGQAVPGSPPAELIGAAMTFSYDDQGKVVDVAMDAAMPASLAGPLKQMLTAAMGAAPPMTLSVGESITVPARLDLPNPAAPNTLAMQMTGETRYTLTSVTFDGADRIAHLKSATTGVVNQASPAASAGPRFTFEIRTSSEGTSDVNIDRGIVLHTEQRMTIDGAMRISAPPHVTPAPPIPPMLIHGTMRISSDLAK